VTLGAVKNGMLGWVQYDEDKDAFTISGVVVVVMMMMLIIITIIILKEITKIRTFFS
jgi:hypothetical protein